LPKRPKEESVTSGVEKHRWNKRSIDVMLADHLMWMEKVRES
jgi:hypothetical protein